MRLKFLTLAMVFQFPTNGKALLNYATCSVFYFSEEKSFNSLRTGKHFWTNFGFAVALLETEFQFPTNGKALLNRLHESLIEYLKEIVSIPYERESTSEPWSPGKSCLTVFSEFQFPTNGKALLNTRWNRRFKSMKVTFQFPTNGKALLNFQQRSPASQTMYTVSIPYERESTSERSCIFRQNLFDFVSIPYERESTSERTRNLLFLSFVSMFQFPTNGKALLNSL